MRRVNFTAQILLSIHEKKNHGDGLIRNRVCFYYCFLFLFYFFTGGTVNSSSIKDRGDPERGDQNRGDKNHGDPNCNHTDEPVKKEQETGDSCDDSDEKALTIDEDKTATNGLDSSSGEVKEERSSTETPNAPEEPNESKARHQFSILRLE